MYQLHPMLTDVVVRDRREQLRRAMGNTRPNRGAQPADRLRRRRR